MCKEFRQFPTGINAARRHQDFFDLVKKKRRHQPAFQSAAVEA
jgi:hypothetical protein